MRSGVLIITATALCSIFSCKKNNDKSNNNTPLSVSAISPLHGPGGINISISGKGFSTNAGGNAVKVNGKAATVVSTNDSTLVVTIPSLAGTGPVVVSVAGNTVNGPTFTYDTVYAVSTYAGGLAGNKDGTGINAQFQYPVGICSDPGGNLYVTDRDNYSIRKIAPGGVVSTIAGSGTQGYKDGQADTAQFNSPMDICRDGQGNLYITDLGNYEIRRLTTSGNVSTFAGTIQAQGYADGTGSAAQFQDVMGICMNAGGTFDITDFGSAVIRSMTAAGDVGTLAGFPYAQGSQDGTGQSARFSYPYGICADKAGNLFVTDYGASKILKITASGTVTTYAGSGTKGNADGTGTSASFSSPTGICADTLGNLYVADYSNFLIRRINSAGVVTTVAGTGKHGNADGIGTSASFGILEFICIDSQGNLYIADSDNHSIRKISIK